MNKDIQTALRIAERLRSGDVSGEMISACLLRNQSDFDDAEVQAEDDFKAMAQQLIKECENE